MDRWRQELSCATGRSGVTHAHLAGVAGRGMAGLAQVLVQDGAIVTGSERAPGEAVERLRRLGVRVHTHPGHESRPCPRSSRMLVCGPETGRIHPERLSAQGRGLEVRTPAQCLGSLLAGRIGLGVRGGRVAGSASAMIGWILAQAGLDPTVVLGTAASQLGGWARLGQGPHFVLEALPGAGLDREAWGAQPPMLALFLDHGANPDPAAEVEESRSWTACLSETCTVLAQAGSSSVEATLSGRSGAVEWFGLERGVDWWGADLRDEGGRFRFRAFRRGRFVLEVRLQVPGRRNVLAALAAVAACVHLDVPSRQIQQGLEEFAGVSRDFESRGSFRGVTLIDDEGGDPEAVGETLRLGRRIFGERRIWAALGAPRDPLDAGTRGRYVEALACADEVVLVDDPLQPSDPAAAGLCRALESRNLAEALAAAGMRARGVGGLDDAILDLNRHLEPGDVLVTLGAGDVGTISDAFIRRLPRDRPG